MHNSLGQRRIAPPPQGGDFMKYQKIAAKTLLWAGVLLFAMYPAFGATLTATPDHSEFGTIDEGVNAIVNVVIENTGISQVEITNIQTS